MGIPVEPTWPPYEEGVPCATCWGTGKAFGDYLPPKYMLATFTGLVACWPGGPQPKNGAFTLTQVAACHWQYSDVTHQVDYYVSAATRQLWQGVPGGPEMFFMSQAGSDCQVAFDNQFVIGDCGPAILAHSGSGKVEWAFDFVPTMLCYDYGFHPIDVTMYDLFYTDEGVKVYRFARIETNANVAIKYIPP